MIEALFGTAEAFFRPAYTALVPRTVPAGGGYRVRIRALRHLVGYAMAQRIPPHALSRANSYEWMGSPILLPVGFLTAGPVAAATSAEAVLVVGGVLTAAVLALGLVPRETRTLRRTDSYV